MKTGVAMKAGMRWLSVFLFGAGTLAVSPQRAQADGCAFPQKSAASLEVTATKQRALVWLRGGSCPTDDGDDYVACSVAGSEFPATWFLLAMVVLGALFIAGRRRER